MKSLLKLIGTLALTTSPVLAVVACDSEDKQMSPKDILNAAAALITDSNLKVVYDLNLPDSIDLQAMKDKIFSELDNTMQSAISNFFTNKLKESTNQNPTNWYHPDAHVSIIDVESSDADIAAKAKFTIPASYLVNGHLLVAAKITYSNLPAITKNITLTLNNDTTKSSDQIKADAIRDFIQQEINNDNLNVNVENLPVSEPLSSLDMARTQLSFIQQNLNDAIKEKVQYIGLSLSFSFSGDFNDTTGSKSTLFTLTGTSVNVDDNRSIIFNGKINNLTIRFLIGTDGNAEYNTGDATTTHTIKINQTFADATTQILKIFTEYTVKPVATLPTASEKYSEYIKANPTIEDEFISDGYFAAINKIYNDTIMVNGWTKGIISITNPDSQFNFNTEKSGYFSLNFLLSYNLKNVNKDSNSEFNIPAENIHIILRSDK